MLLQRPTKRASQLLFAVAIVLLPFVAGDVYGCQCRERQPPCSQYAAADVVFSGLVKKITPPNEGDFRETISFNVEKPFKGVSDNVVDITDSRTSCSVSFKEGEKYLVYAYRSDDKKLYTSYCTRTAELLKADADLAYLNSLSQKPQPTEIVGRLTYYDRKLRRISVVVTSGNATYRTVSDENGWFRVKVPAGKYRVRMLLPLYTSISGTSVELEGITGYKVTKRGIVVDYEVSVDAGECSFVDPPLFIENDEYEKHRGLNPVPLTNKRQR